MLAGLLGAYGCLLLGATAYMGWRLHHKLSGVEVALGTAPQSRGGASARRNRSRREGGALW